MLIHMNFWIEIISHVQEAIDKTRLYILIGTFTTQTWHSKFWIWQWPHIYEASLGRETSTNHPLVNFIMPTEADFFIGALGSTWCYLIDIWHAEHWRREGSVSVARANWECGYVKYMISSSVPLLLLCCMEHCFWSTSSGILYIKNRLYSLVKCINISRLNYESTSCMRSFGFFCSIQSMGNWNVSFMVMWLLWTRVSDNWMVEPIYYYFFFHKVLIRLASSMRGGGGAVFISALGWFISHELIISAAIHTTCWTRTGQLLATFPMSAPKIGWANDDSLLTVLSSVKSPGGGPGTVSRCNSLEIAL